MTSDTSSQVLILHGAGESGRCRFNFFREHLLSNGISSCAFDFIGHGDTGGDIKRSNLYERTKQACKTIRVQQIPPPLKIVGASMGAYTAVKLTKYYEIEKLVLMVPAVYDSAAYTVPFNEGFTQIIRYHRSWVRSDAWSLLSAYEGDLLIVAAENDEVIPTGVVEKLYESAARARQRQLYIAPGVSHFIFTELRSRDPEEYERAMGMIVKMLQ